MIARRIVSVVLTGTMVLGGTVPIRKSAGDGSDRRKCERSGFGQIDGSDRSLSGSSTCSGFGLRVEPPAGDRSQRLAEDAGQGTAGIEASGGSH